MKRLLIICAAILSITAPAANLEWDDLNPPGVVASFRVWREEAPGSWSLIATVTTNSWKIVLPAGEHRIAVSAVGATTDALESALSPAKAITVLIHPTIPRIVQ